MSEFVVKGSSRAEIGTATTGTCPPGKDSGILIITIEQLTTELSAELCGDGSGVISGAHSLENSATGDITFVDGEINLRKLKTSNASAVLVGRKLQKSPLLKNVPQAVLVVKDAKQAFLKVLEMFHPPRQRVELGVSMHATVHPSASIGRHTNVHPGAHIAEGVVVGEHCDIHPGVCLGAGCQVGDGSVLHPNVVLYPDVKIGNRVTLHAGAVIGNDGFGYQFDGGSHRKLPHFGTVRIEDDVEIGANTTIDRAMVGETVIGRGTKIDNLVMIAHNCQLGTHNVVAALTGFAGSSSTGDYVVCAGQVGVADHVHLGTGAVLGAHSGATKSLPGGQTYLGAPAEPVEESRKQYMIIRKLPQMRDQLRELITKVRDLESQIQVLAASTADETLDSKDSAAA